MEVVVTVRPLADLEATIERGLTTFVEVGQALLEIREHRLYRETHESFETYCRERWGFSRPRAYQLMQAAEVASSLSTNVDTPPLETEAQARELARLKDEPEAVREVWSEVKETHGDAVTAADVRSAVDRRLGVERTQPTRRAPDRDYSDDYVEDVNQDPEWTPPGYTPEAWAYEQATNEAPPTEPSETVADMVADGFVIPPRGLDPHRKAWYAAIAPSHFTRLDPASVIATTEPRELERGLESLDEAIAYLERLRVAGRAAHGRTRLEVVQ